MKNYWIVLIVFILVIHTKGVAQTKEGVKKEGAHQSEYNANATEREHSPEIDSRNPNHSDSSSSDVGQQDNFEDNRHSDVNTPSPAGTKTTSSSGSPGVLMGDHNTPDGTNTIQSATPNIAGSPVPGAKKENAKKPGIAENKNFSNQKRDLPHKKENKTGDTKANTSK
jgi:hypothetical protein